MLNLAKHGYIISNWVDLAKLGKTKLNQGIEVIFG
jgi:hypothetical protein